MRAILVIAFLTACATTAVVAYKDSDPLAWWDTVRRHSSRCTCALILPSFLFFAVVFKDEKEEYTSDKEKRIPFPQCLVSGSKSRLFDSSSVQRLFDKTLRKEEEDLKQEGYENYKHNNGKNAVRSVLLWIKVHLDGHMDYDSDELRHGDSESRSAARAALKLTGEIMTVLMCDLNGTDSSNL